MEVPSRAKMVDAFLQSSLLGERDDSLVVGRQFIDHDVEPHPAVGPKAVSEFHQNLNGSFDVAHRSYDYGPKHVITHVTLRPKSADNVTRAKKGNRPVGNSNVDNSKIPASDSLWIWRIRGGEIVERWIYLEPVVPLYKWGRIVGPLLQTIYALRVSIIVVALFAAALLLEPGQEVLRMAAGAAGNDTSYSYLLDTLGWPFFFAAAVLIQSLTVIAFHSTNPLFPGRTAIGRLWFPPSRGWQVALAGLLATAVFLILALALWSASRIVSDSSIVPHMRFYAGVHAVVGIVALMVSLVWILQKWVFWNDRWVRRGGVLAPVVILIMALLGYFFPNDGLKIGPAGLAFSMTVFLVVASLLAIAGDRVRIPFLSILGLVFLVNAWNGWDDHHAVETKQVINPTPFLPEHFEKWLSDRRKQLPPQATPAAQPPIFIVVSEGGGIRAAILTAMVLDELRSRFPNFQPNLYAIVGVSGGSVGAAAYASALYQKAPPADIKALATTSSSQGWQSSLHQDLLSPTIRSLVGVDFWSRWIPKPIFDLSNYDRARALESAWTDSWKTVTGRDISSLYFKSLRPEGGNIQPALVLLTTDVRLGDRLALSHVRFQPRKGEVGCTRRPLLRTLADVDDSIDVPLSTAAFMSARFPGISPAARVDTKHESQHYVDGGYFENSGITTALDLIHGIRCKAQTTKIVIIRIENSEVKKLVTDKEPSPPRFFDVLGPLGSLYASGDAHGKQALEQLEVEVADSKRCRSNNICGELDQIVFKLAPPANDVPIVLSWFITGASRAEIAAQLLQGSNVVEFDKVSRSLSGR
jgi:hypothetical protein